MKTSSYNILNKKAIKYRLSLNLDDIKREFLTESLLNQNFKLSKGDIVNFGLELTPANFSQAQKDISNCENFGICLMSCIFFTGYGQMLKSKNLDLSPAIKKRIRRDFLLKNDKYFFIEKLKHELDLLNRTYINCAVRLNVVSDIDWTKELDFSIYQNITFYDYTKIKERVINNKIHFTYSASEKDSNEDLIALLNKGFNIAMVFSDKLPISWHGFKVVDGDVNDNRFNDEKGVVVGLKNKTAMQGKEYNKFTTRGEQ